MDLLAITNGVAPTTVMADAKHTKDVDRRNEGTFAMALKIAHRTAEEVPVGGSNTESAEFTQIKAELAKLQAGMVLEIETGSAKAIRGTKSMLTRAGKQAGRPVVHWHQGTTVYAKSSEPAKRRGRPPKAATA